MTYIIKQKLMSLTDSYRIFDQEENQVYEVRQKMMKLVGNLDFYDNIGNLVMNAKQDFLVIPARYQLIKNGVSLATIQKRFTLLTKKFDITSPLGEFYVEGNIFDYNFSIYKEGTIVATVSKKILSWTDTYALEIFDDKDKDIILAMAIVIDKLAHENQN
jgi:uncharacterized protein YxjI